MMEQYQLCWPEEQSMLAQHGMLLLVAVEPSEDGDGRVMPCRVVGRLAPGGLPFPVQKAAKPTAPLAERVSRLLIALGVPTNLLGYAYLRTAVLLTISHPEMLRGMNRQLYPQVAAEHGVTARSVERAIRHAIGQTWARGGGEACRRLLGRQASCVGDRPTNGEFITLLTDRLVLEQHRENQEDMPRI